MKDSVVQRVSEGLVWSELMNGSTKGLTVDLKGTHGTLVIFKGLNRAMKRCARENKVGTYEKQDKGCCADG